MMTREPEFKHQFPVRIIDLGIGGCGLLDLRQATKRADPNAGWNRHVCRILFGWLVVLDVAYLHFMHGGRLFRLEAWILTGVRTLP